MKWTHLKTEDAFLIDMKNGIFGPSLDFLEREVTFDSK